MCDKTDLAQMKVELAWLHSIGVADEAKSELHGIIDEIEHHPPLGRRPVETLMRIQKIICTNSDIIEGDRRSYSSSLKGGYRSPITTGLP